MLTGKELEDQEKGLQNVTRRFDSHPSLHKSRNAVMLEFLHIHCADVSQVLRQDRTEMTTTKAKAL